MTSARWHDVPLAKQHDRKSFDCGDADLNDWFVRYARQNHASGGAKTFVATSDTAPNAVLGFYSLSPASLEFTQAPAIITRGLGRFDVPLFRLGRLAVDRTWQGRGLGAGLLVAAGQRCLAVSAQVGGVGLLIDAKNEAVAAWYAGFGAVSLTDLPLTLVLPFATFQRALNSEN